MDDLEQQNIEPEQSETAPEQEQMVPQNKVNALIGNAMKKADAKARAELEREYQHKMEQMQSSQGEQVASTQYMQQRNAGHQDVDADVMYQQIRERLNKDIMEQQLNAEITKVADNYYSRMGTGADKYDDFEEITSAFDPSAFPQLVYIASNLDNASDVIYELSKNPMKLANLNTLAEKSPKLAEREMLKLATSITENQQAQADAQQYSTDDPLSKIQPSRVTGNNGKLSISDLRQQPWLKG